MNENDFMFAGMERRCADTWTKFGLERCLIYETDVARIDVDHFDAIGPRDMRIIVACIVDSPVAVG